MASKKEKGNMKKEELRIGNKIKDIEIDRTQYLAYLRVLLVLFNLLLLAGIIALIVYINKWYVYLIDILLLAFCVYRSFVTIHAAKKKHNYTLYSNALVLNSLWYDTAVDLSTVYKVIYKKTWLDKLTKRGTHSIIVYFYNNGYYKIKMHNITEDANELANEIMRRALETKAEKEFANSTNN